jgi:hypothetical protein
MQRSAATGFPIVTFSKRAAQILVLLLLGLVPAVLSAQPQAKPLGTGPDVGQRIPAFEVVDHSGRSQTFESLKGPKGLLLLFYRSADW